MPQEGRKTEAIKGIGKVIQDRFVKVMLVVIAALLVFNLFRPQTAQTTLELPSLVSSAQAQTSQNTDSTPTTYKVRSLNGFSVADLKDVVAVGDGKSFVVSNPKGFVVYQVAPSR